MVWTAVKNHLGQRPPFHIPLRTCTSQQDWGQAKFVDCVPPSNQWALRMEEPMGRTIPTPCRECTTGGLELMAHGGICGAQRPHQFHAGCNPHRNPVRLSTHSPPRSECGDEQSDSGTMHRDPASKTRSSDRGNQQGGESRSNSRRKVQGGRPSLVGGIEFETALPYSKVGPQTSRTFPRKRSNIASGLSTCPPPVMGSP